MLCSTGKLWSSLPSGLCLGWLPWFTEVGFTLQNPISLVSAYPNTGASCRMWLWPKIVKIWESTKVSSTLQNESAKVRPCVLHKHQKVRALWEEVLSSGQWFIPVTKRQPNHNGYLQKGVREVTDRILKKRQSQKLGGFEEYGHGCYLKVSTSKMKA